MLEKVAIREAGVGKGGTKRGFCCKSWHKERLELEKMALREAFVEKVGIKRGLCWKRWH